MRAETVCTERVGGSKAFEWRTPAAVGTMAEGEPSYYRSLALGCMGSTGLEWRVLGLLGAAVVV